MQNVLDRLHPALVHQKARRFRLRPPGLGGLLAAGAPPLFLGVTGVAALSNEGPGEALKFVLRLLLVRFSFLPLAFGLLGLQDPCGSRCTSRLLQFSSISYLLLFRRVCVFPLLPRTPTERRRGPEGTR
jgi:hypothetical protein